MSEHNADHLMRSGAIAIGIGILILTPAAALLVRLEHTPANHRQIVTVVVILFLLGYAVIQYGGLKLGRGHNQGGKLGLKPRTVRFLWAVAEYYSAATAFLCAVGGAFLAAALILGRLNAALWVLFVFTLLTCVVMFGISRHVRERRQRLYPHSD